MIVADSVCATPLEGEPLGFGEGTSADGTARIGRGVSEDKFLEKESRPQLFRWLRYGSGDTRAISSDLQVPLPEVWLRVVDTVRAPSAGAVCPA